MVFFELRLYTKEGTVKEQGKNKYWRLRPASWGSMLRYEARLLFMVPNYFDFATSQTSITMCAVNLIGEFFISIVIEDSY